MKTEPVKYALRTVKGLLILPDTEIVLFRFHESNWQVMQTDRTIHILCTHITANELLKTGINFLQIRRDCIINTDYLKFIENYSLRCILTPPFQDIELFVSRRYYIRIQQSFHII